ncbi:MAG TPA: hypothetical protein VGS22_11115 [Thermoanaerobaculia bacterium]|jgi:hypothetical protein|nr:hypothetical protein [Thermoanaerobaculia bacterium]
MNHVDPELEDDLQPEYDFSEAVQGKHYLAYREGTNVAFLDPDVAEVFTSSEAVNQALRLLLNLARDQAQPRSA